MSHAAFSLAPTLLEEELRRVSVYARASTALYPRCVSCVQLAASRQVHTRMPVDAGDGGTATSLARKWSVHGPLNNVMTTIFQNTCDQTVLGACDCSAIDWGSNPRHVVEALLRGPMGLSSSLCGKVVYRKADPSVKLQMLATAASNTRRPADRGAVDAAIAGAGLPNDPTAPSGAAALRRELVQPEAADALLARGTGYGKKKKSI